MIITIDESKIYQHWNKGKIEELSKEKGLTFLETILYLWLYNNVSISAADRSKDSGRQMYEKFAKGVAKLLEEETKDEEMENRFRFRVWCKALQKFQYFQFNTKDGCSLPHSNWFNEKEPIQQCTGIKDKFGNLIYEGDIVREINITGRDEEYINEVKWVKGGFDINVDPDFSLEIIGNIYENKKILEEIEK